MGWRVRSFAAERALVDEDRVDPPEFNVRDMVRIRSIIRMMVMFGLFIRTVQSGVFCFCAGVALLLVSVPSRLFCLAFSKFLRGSERFFFGEGGLGSNPLRWEEIIENPID